MASSSFYFQPVGTLTRKQEYALKRGSEQSTDVCEEALLLEHGSRV